MRRLLIVNADDFGLTPPVTRGVVRAHREGIVTSASVMPCARGFDDAVRAYRENPGLDCGVHLTYVEERPVLAGSPPFPRHYPGFFRALAFGRIRLADVEREWRAQVERCFAAGLTPTHLDSHQHLHVFPPLFPIVLRMARDYGIRWVRVPRPPFEKGRRGVGVAVLLASGMIDARRAAGKVAMCDRVCGIGSSGRLDTAALIRSIDAHPGGIVELLCHPGEEDGELLRDYGWWRYRWAGECAALTHPDVRRSLESAGVELTNFRKCGEHQHG